MTFKKVAPFTLLILATILVGSYFWADLETTKLNNELRNQLGINYVDLKHGATHYELIGKNDAETVVLVHGFSTPNYIWDKNVDSLLAAGFRVLRFDLYGRGYSNTPELDYTLELFVEQLNDLTKTLKIKSPFHLVGISMGGAITTRFSVQHPDKIKSLSLLAPLVATPNRLDLNLIKMPFLGEYLATMIMMPRIKNNIEDMIYDPNSYPEWTENVKKHIHFKGYRRALLSTARNLAGQSELETYKALGKTAIPVQLIWGIEDPIADYAQAQTLQNAIPSLTLHTLEKSGHLPQIEHAQQVNTWLSQHLLAN